MQNYKYTIEEMRELAISRGGKCLSSEFLGVETKLQWECTEKHVWYAKPKHVLEGHWCAECSLVKRGIKSRKYTLEDVKRLVAAKHGKCLSTSFEGISSKIEVECCKGHIWSPRFDSLLYDNRWCPYCAKIDRQKYGLEEAQALAKSKGGICLSVEVAGIKSKVKMKCEFGHIFTASLDSMQNQNTWCPDCANLKRRTPKKHSIETFKEIALKKGGLCLSSQYRNPSQKLLFRCKEGHEWEAIASSILRGHWCRRCLITTSLEEVKQKIADRGGQLLSDLAEVTSRTRILIRCSDGHEFKATVTNILNGRWCPDCHGSAGENICRAYFEYCFGAKFPKSYPGWLKQAGWQKLELDGYCESLGIAFEHQGVQHYKICPPMIRTKDELDVIRAKDRVKKFECRAHGVRLFIIPDIVNIITVGRFIKYMAARIVKSGLPLSNDPYSFAVDLNLSSSKLEMLRSFALAKEGKLLTETYLGTGKNHVWECKKGHIWKATPSNVVGKGTWCKVCSLAAKRHPHKLTIEDMRTIAISRGGICISELYVNSRTKLTWKCKYGHQFNAVPNQVKDGTWCPTCAIERRKLRVDKVTVFEELKALALSRGGRLLSTSYVNSNSKLLWECKNNHKWEASPYTIKKGHWCGKCHQLEARKPRKYTIDSVKNIAKAKAGECLSEEYITVSSNLTWKCSKGHIWQATLANVSRGTWCPICAIERRFGNKYRSKKPLYDDQYTLLKD